ncbi:5350_t:CDS:2, partial [Scutellospora calospora]
MISSFRLLTLRVLDNFKPRKRFFSLNVPVASVNSDLFPFLIMIKQIYDEHKTEIKQIYDEHKTEMKKLEKIIQKSDEYKEEMIQKLGAKDEEMIQELNAKDIEHKEELLKLLVKQKDDEAELVARSTELFKLRGICNIRSALDFIQSGDPLGSRGTDDYLVENLNFKDLRFKKCLEETCEMNNVNVEAVKKCIGGLYHNSSKELDGYGKIVIYAKDWAVNEIIALGLIFKYFRVPFEYWNENEQ